MRSPKWSYQYTPEEQNNLSPGKHSCGVIRLFYFIKKEYAGLKRYLTNVQICENLKVCRAIFSYLLKKLLGTGVSNDIELLFNPTCSVFLGISMRGTFSPLLRHVFSNEAYLPDPLQKMCHRSK